MSSLQISSDDILKIENLGYISLKKIENRQSAIYMSEQVHQMQTVNAIISHKDDFMKMEDGDIISFIESQI
jgi:hypothetical protein